jgi:hypothetical protein
MPVTHWIDEDTGIQYQKWQGFIQLEEIVRFERAMRDAGGPPRDAIIDVSELTGSDVTAEQMTYLATMPQKAARVALVAPNPARFGRARMFEMMAEAQQQPTTIRVFRSIEEAKSWLSSAGR